MPPPPKTTHSTSTSTISLTTTVLLTLLLLTAFFPSLFHYLWTVPLALVNPYTYLSLLHPSPSSRDNPKHHDYYDASARDCCRGCAEDYTSGARNSRSSSPEERNDKMAWHQSTITLPTKSRGSYLITDYVLEKVPEIKEYRVGILNLFVQHTSCALSLNENWDEDVRADMSDALDRLAPEDNTKKGELYRHSAEGKDDMPAHIKSALIGASVSIPITDGRLATGTWQGIWYLEFRTSRHSRKVVATIQGEKKAK